MSAQLTFPEADFGTCDGSPGALASVFEAPVPARRKARGYAGFSCGQILLGAALAGFAIWGVWLTREITAMAERRIVAVSLSGMVGDFVAVEARSGNSPEQVQEDTRQFMAELDKVLSARAAKGETVIVSEAVVAGSAPDITSEVRGALGKRMLASRKGAAPAPVAAAPGGLPGQ